MLEMKLYKIGVLIISAVILTSCFGGRTVKVDPLFEPKAPNLPVVKKEELECVSDETFDKLDTRDVLRDDYEEKMRAVIRSTH